MGILLYEMLVGLPPFYSENMNEMYELILKAPLKFPSFVPSDAQSLLKGLLERDEGKRLGSGTSDYKEIQQHPFFSSMDWEKLYQRKIKPPFIPEKSTDETKAEYFDEEFTSEQVKDSFAQVPSDKVSTNFDEFSYNEGSNLKN